MNRSKNINTVHVAVGVIQNTNGEILIAKRPNHVHQGGLWEFPGGKIHEGETVTTALVRELNEELNINVINTSPLITIPHEYPDKTVYLDVYLVTEFTGQPHGNEGQQIRWVSLTDISGYKFPDANQPIIMALTLPDKYLITGKFEDFSECEQKVLDAIGRGIRLIQLREKQMETDDFIELAQRLYQITSQSGTKLILNTSIDVFNRTGADGIHMTGERLAECQARPVGKDKLFSVSTHTFAELQHASKIDADFAMLSPVLPTNSHPGEPALGGRRPCHRDIHRTRTTRGVPGGRAIRLRRPARSVGAGCLRSQVRCRRPNRRGSRRSAGA